MVFLVKDIFNLIDEKYEFFSKTFKIISDYIKQNYSSISFLSIQELSEKVGVSPASITRFSQEIGFSGYPAFQKEIQMWLQKEIIPMKEIKNSIAECENEENILKRTIDQNIETLSKIYSSNLNESFNKAIELIHKARRVYIVGMRSSYSVAYYLYFMLSQFMDNVILLETGKGDIFDRISYSKKEDVLVAISFSKYTKLTYQVVQYFSNNGSPIISVTDSFSSPIAIKSDAVLIAPNSSTTYSFVSAMSILNALIIGIGKKDKQRTLEKMKEKEKVAIDNDIYL